jgi:PhnB protein
MKKKSALQLTPYLLYKDVGKALNWLTKAFGFIEDGERFTAEDGTIQHAAMKISKDGDPLMMGCPGPKYKNPKKLGNVTVLMYVDVDNVDKHFARAKKAGAKIIEKPADTFYGARRYGATDPEGHQWYFAQELTDAGKKRTK